MSEAPILLSEQIFFPSLVRLLTLRSSLRKPLLTLLFLRETRVGFNVYRKLMAQQLVHPVTITVTPEYFGPKKYTHDDLVVQCSCGSIYWFADIECQTHEHYAKRCYSCGIRYYLDPHCIGCNFDQIVDQLPDPLEGEVLRTPSPEY